MITDFAKEHILSPEYSEREKRLHDFATQYHTECEAYNRTIFPGLILNDVIMPMTFKEMAKISHNAHVILRRLERSAECEGIGREELHRAIRNWKSLGGA